MSHSEGKKELAGLARSVEALFGPGPAPAEEVAQEAEPAPGPAVSEDLPAIASSPGVGVPDDDFMGGFDTLFDDAAPRPSESTSDAASGLDSDEPVEWGSAIEPILDLDAGPIADSGNEAGEVSRSDAVADFAFEADPAFPGDTSGTFAAQDDTDEAQADEAYAAVDAPDGSSEEALAPATGPGVHDVPTVDLGLLPDDETGEITLAPMDIAVDALLAGDATRGSEVERLAAELIERKEVEPIARSVARLVHAAGTPPDPTLYGLAESLMSPVVLGRLARRIGTERDEARRHAYFAVCIAIGRDMAQALRVELADSTNRLSRRIHYDALVAMGDASRPVIEEMIHDDNRFLVRNAVSILGDTGGDNAVELVTSALANPDSRVRREALLSLAKLGDAEASQLIPGFFDDPDPDVRQAAVVAAGELRVERALRPLIALLDEAHEPDEVIPLLRALGQIGDPGAVMSIERHAVRPLFSKPRTAIRIAAHRALAPMGTPQARRLLQQALGDKDPEVKAAVKQVLHMR